MTPNEFPKSDPGMARVDAATRADILKNLPDLEVRTNRAFKAKKCRDLEEDGQQLDELKTLEISWLRVQRHLPTRVPEGLMAALKNNIEILSKYIDSTFEKNVEKLSQELIAKGHCPHHNHQLPLGAPCPTCGLIT